MIGLIENMFHRNSYNSNANVGSDNCKTISTDHDCKFTPDKKNSYLFKGYVES